MLDQLLKDIEGKRALIIGDIMLDVYCHGTVGRLNPEEPAAPLLDLTRREYRAGGAANVATNAKALGVEATLLGVIGQDPAGEMLQNILDQQGITLVSATSSYQPRTIEKTRLMAGQRQIARLDNEDKNPLHYKIDTQSMNTQLQALVKQSDFIIFSDYAKGVVDSALMEFISSQARSLGLPVVLDPKPKNKINFSSLVDVITPNRKEALELAGMDSAIDFSHGKFPAEAVCAKIHERYNLPHIVITMSEEGFLVSSRGGAAKRAPTYARKVFDVTGAGDTFVTALACALAAGADINEAAELANVASGVVVEKPGTAVATAQEILAHSALIV